MFTTVMDQRNQRIYSADHSLGIEDPSSSSIRVEQNEEKRGKKKIPKNTRKPEGGGDRPDEH